MLNTFIYSNVDSSRRIKIQCAILKDITCQLPQINIDVQKLNIPDGIQLADPEFGTPGDIDMLIGADCYYNLLSDGIIYLGKRLPVLQNTNLGWLVAGNVPNYCISNNSQSFANNLLTKFWTVEEIPQKSSLSDEDEAAENNFIATTKVLEDGRFQVNMPLKTPTEHQKLGDSFSIAKKRFSMLEKRFQNNPKLFSEYKDFIDEYIALGHAKYVPLTMTNSNLENKYFIPHLCVIRELSTTTKLRVVFDASCKSSSGYSLNDVTLKGFQV
ncbi:uncharacterized protein LOC108914070 [Anoplophora glabripennis]|uniref:uncharacterized protein LOC108914070 n=1 Tax=Anoplophora glabripennis TaxID=217634 RepID=UPI000874EF16|nr:uncharacterized protein LOC108914070 [Anoplophora glabripennis]